MDSFTIGQLAGLAGVGVETVRFYERRGLIDQPRRPGSGYRRYPPEAVARIRFVRRAKQLGFSLEEIKELLAFRTHPSATSAEVRRRASAKIVDIESKISDLQGMRGALAELVASCDGCGPVADCSILEALDSDDEESPEWREEDGELEHPIG